ncbi:hypothetical protein [Calothrix sp. NIES-2100]|uniref:hypothetical protein n=1 Tax=Calothrix sp. NIES-2100 TaxID=1954172 RepID=UPI0030D6FA9C
MLRTAKNAFSTRGFRQREASRTPTLKQATRSVSPSEKRDVLKVKRSHRVTMALYRLTMRSPIFWKL